MKVYGQLVTINLNCILSHSIKVHRIKQVRMVAVTFQARLQL